MRSTFMRNAYQTKERFIASYEGVSSDWGEAFKWNQIIVGRVKRVAEIDDAFRTFCVIKIADPPYVHSARNPDRPPFKLNCLIA